LQAWQSAAPALSLKIVGDGPLSSIVQHASRQNQAIEYLGRRSSDDVMQLMAQAEFLVFPTECYEGMPRTVIESFAVGTPVVASNLGSTANMIVPGETGFQFTPGSVSELRERVEWCSQNLDRLRAMRSKARQAFENNYTGVANARMLLAIYKRAQEAAGRAHSG
jgi:glycosyltransferase involved in cell wall biosynthesis